MHKFTKFWLAGKFVRLGDIAGNQLKQNSQQFLNSKDYFFVYTDQYFIYSFFHLLNEFNVRHRKKIFYCKCKNLQHRE